jgi:hypothetical protein
LFICIRWLRSALRNEPTLFQRPQPRASRPLRPIRQDLSIRTGPFCLLQLRSAGLQSRAFLCRLSLLFLYVVIPNRAVCGRLEGPAAALSLHVAPACPPWRGTSACRQAGPASFFAVFLCRLSLLFLLRCHPEPRCLRTS